MTAVVHDQPQPLTLHDRCDRCGARAQVRVVLVTGGELLFCGHHGRANLPALKRVTRVVRDEREWV